MIGQIRHSHHLFEHVTLFEVQFGAMAGKTITCGTWPERSPG